jgi:GNAT superfamily N-acetyltransferase
MVKIKRTASGDSDFQNLVRLLDEYLEIIDGKEYSFFAQFNKLDAIKNVVVYYHDDIAAGCGAFKEFDGRIVEIKRMFVRPDFRGRGVGRAVLKELELWAAELNYSESILETHKNLPEAIRLYQKAGYHLITNFGQYANVEASVCMKKIIKE